jgi:hypothetical protein
VVTGRTRIAEITAIATTRVVAASRVAVAGAINAPQKYSVCNFYCMEAKRTRKKEDGSGR